MKSKIVSALLSVFFAFGLWLYVITVVSPNSSETIGDIPVTMVGESALEERNLMITKHHLLIQNNHKLLEHHQSYELHLLHVHMCTVHMDRFHHQSSEVYPNQR